MIIISSYCVEAKSRMELRQLAKKIRKMFGLENELYFPIVDVLELLPEFDSEAYFEVVEVDELEPGEHAVTDVISKTIKIRSDVYEGAFNGIGRDRMTLAHEFAHFITLCVCGFRLARSFDGYSIPAYKDPEWQAKCLAGELMIDSELIKNMPVEEVSDKCGVSIQAATIQKNALI